MSKDIKITLLNPEETQKLFYDWGITSSVCYDTKTNKPEKIGQHCLKSGHTSGSRGTYIKFKIENVPRFTLDQLFMHEQGVFKNMGSFRYIGKNNFCYEIPQEILDNEDFGVEDYFNKDGICMIEWAELIEDRLPEERLDINFKIIDENTRVLVFIPHGERYEELCNAVL